MSTPGKPAVENQQRRIDDIEWLRAIAVPGGGVHHAQGNLFSWNPAWLGNLLSHVDMWSGVDIFFAISGFVVARSLLPWLLACQSGIGKASRQVGAFWVARAFRLLPSAWLWLGLVLLGAWLFNRLGAFGSVHTNVMARWQACFRWTIFVLPMRSPAILWGKLRLLEPLADRAVLSGSAARRPVAATPCRVVAAHSCLCAGWPTTTGIF